MRHLPATFQHVITANRRWLIRWQVALVALFLSRIGAEFLLPTAPILGALGGLLGGGVLAWWFVRQEHPPGFSALFLLPYILSIYQNPALALTCGVLALISWLARTWSYHGWWVDGGVFGVALVLFGATLATGVQPADGGEFQLVIGNWGVAHPPGYPLYTLLGGLLTRLIPWGDMAWRVNLYSALTGALTLALLSNAVRRSTQNTWAGIIAAGALGTATSIWTTSTQASIRPMTALFMVLMLEAVLTYHRARQTDDDRQANRALVRFGLAAGFGVTHHASLFFAGSTLALAIIAARPRLVLEVRRWLPMIGAALLGALPWSYLLARGAAGAVLAPPNLTSWDGFWQHVLATGFAGDMFAFRTLPEIAARLQLTAQVIAFQWHTLILILAIIAFGLLLWRDRWLFLAIGGAFAVHTFVAATYRAPQTVEYMIPAYVCLAAGIGWSINAVQAATKSKTLFAVLTSIAALGIVWSATPTWTSLRLYQQRDQTASTAQALLETAPTDSLILANWHHVTPLWYIQAENGLRPDVTAQYVAPAGAEDYIDTWTRLVTEASTLDRPTVACSYYPERYQHADLTFSSLASCWQINPDSTELPAEQASATYEDIMLYPGQIPASGTIGETTFIDLNWQLPEATPYGTLTTFIHLVDKEGVVVAQNDQPVHAAALQRPGMVTQRYPLLLPRTLPPGTYTLLTGVYGSTGPILNENTEERTTIGALTIHPTSVPPVTQNPRYRPFGDMLILLGYDYDFSVPGRARLYLHWYSKGSTERFAISINNATEQLAAGTLIANTTGYTTTAYDIPDTAAATGVTLNATQNSEPLGYRGAWQIPFGTALTIPPVHMPTRYIMVGDVVITDYAIDFTQPDTAQVTLTMRSLNAITQDVGLQLAADAVAQKSSIPVGGTIPTLKWGWGATINDTLTLPLPPGSSTPEMLTLTFFDAFTSEAWPIVDPNLGQTGPNLRLMP